MRCVRDPYLVSHTTSLVFVQDENNVKQWLHQISMQQYWPLFESAGYDDLQYMLDLDAEDIQKQIGVTKPGHVKKLLVELQRVQL